MTNKAFTITMVFFALLGIFFFSIMIHEVFHSIHMKGAKTICVATNLKIADDLQDGYLIAYTDFNLSEYENAEEYYKLRETSEKIAAILTPMLFILISFLFGYWFHKEMK